MFLEIFKEVLPIFGVAVGAILSAFLTKTSETKKYLLALRQQAYAEYLESIAQAKFARTNEQNLLANQKCAQAKTKIIIYGEINVIDALAEFELSGAKLDNNKSINEFSKLVQEMTFKKSKINNDSIIKILIGDTKK